MVKWNACYCYVSLFSELPFVENDTQFDVFTLWLCMNHAIISNEHNHKETVAMMTYSSQSQASSITFHLYNYNVLKTLNVFN